jgi:hypothetical protein
MILGIVAAQGSGQGQAPPAWVPADAILALDFVNGRYWTGGSVEAAAADVINHPDLVTANGLELRFADESTAGDVVTDIIGDALAILLMLDWTLVIEYERLDDTSQPLLLEMDDDPPSGHTLMIYTGSGFLTAADATPSDFGRIISADDQSPAGIHRVAVTRTDSHLAISVDGSAAKSPDETLSGLAVERAALGGEPGDFLFDECNIRSLTVYPAQIDSALPELSA